MSTRRAKQLIYGTLYLLVVLIVCAGIYFVFVRPVIVASTPSLCTPSTCAPTSTAPIVAGTVSMFITSPGHYTFLAQVANQSADYGAQVLSYEIDLDDASGTVLQSIPGESFIYPSQTKYLAALNTVVTSPFDHASLVIDGVSWLASSTIGAITGIAPGQFAVQNVQGSVAPTTVSVGGQLINTSVASYGQVIVMVIFGTLQNPLGVSQTALNNVAAGSTNNFSIIYPAEPNINPAVSQIIVYALR
jgi:hypothetical protein